jgi:hypothetical protein
MRYVVAILILCVSVAAYAYRSVPQHSCSRPWKPSQFTSQYEVDSYKQQVEMYRHCIEEFVDEQKDAIRAHKRAAEEAIDEWNSFANWAR